MSTLIIKTALSKKNCNIFIKCSPILCVAPIAESASEGSSSNSHTVFTQSESSVAAKAAATDSPAAATATAAAPVKKPVAPRLKSLPAGRTALVTIEIAGREDGRSGFVVIEPTRLGPALSKFALRSRGFTYGVGTSIFDEGSS